MKSEKLGDLLDMMNAASAMLAKAEKFADSLDGEEFVEFNDWEARFRWIEKFHAIENDMKENLRELRSVVAVNICINWDDLDF